MEISGLGFHHEVHASTHVPDPGQITGRIIQRLDQDGDGQLSANELGSKGEQMAEADSLPDTIPCTEKVIFKGWLLNYWVTGLF